MLDQTKDVYKHIKIFWDSIFKNESEGSIVLKDFENNALNKATDFLCENTESVLDFGCGNGSWLFKCSKRGTKYHVGIDLSKEGIAIANKLKAQVTDAQFKFYQGGVSKLEKIKDSSMDAAILSNILDNLVPEDANQLIYQVHRILKPNGKVIIKLNSYLTQEQISEWNIGVIEGNLLDDGLYLWNLTTEEWRNLFSHYFKEVYYEDVYYKEHDQYNRLFCMVKK
ncbi:class I SAM-dependent methyltransferase [Clostridium sp. Marseille-P299]|uniref:class I SAM-dependent methyltransferase n=1 Tax=Clostridium sp. Marseille-P299 TaxID=1805477 RepID=UPI00082B902B|nr:class I SAM-dependent methyltransferase [Clostridium sp. Marseille-P299]